MWAGVSTQSVMRTVAARPRAETENRSKIIPAIKTATPRAPKERRATCGMIPESWNKGNFRPERFELKGY
jgi:hypothetical protein